MERASTNSSLNNDNRYVDGGVHASDGGRCHPSIRGDNLTAFELNFYLYVCSYVCHIYCIVLLCQHTNHAPQIYKYTNIQIQLEEEEQEEDPVCIICFKGPNGALDDDDSDEDGLGGGGTMGYLGMLLIYICLYIYIFID